MILFYKNDSSIYLVISNDFVYTVLSKILYFLSAAYDWDNAKTALNTLTISHVKFNVI